MSPGQLKLGPRTVALIQVVAAVDALEDSVTVMRTLTPIGVLRDKPMLDVGDLGTWAHHARLLAESMERWCARLALEQARSAARRRYSLRGPKGLLPKPSVKRKERGA